LDGTESSSLEPGLTKADAGAISAELLGAFMSLMPDAAVVVDSSGRIVSANEQAEQLFGYPRGTLAGLAIESLVPERARQRHRQHRSAYLGAPQSRPMGAALELTGRRQDGSEFPLDISLAPIVGAGDQMVVAAVRDVTEKRAATAAQAELAAIVRSSLDAIISTTLDGHIANWNPAAEDLLGYSREVILGRHISTLVPDSASIVLEELLDTAYAGDHRGARDTRWRHRDGHEVDVAVSVSPLRDQSGGLLGFSSVVRDISERKRAEHELRRLLEEEEHLERQHAATSEIRLALLSGAPLRDSLTLICERAADLVGAPVAIISDRDVDGVRILAGVGPAAELVGTSLGAGTSFAERVIDSGQVAQVPRRSELSSVAVPSSLPDGPTLGVPIIAGAVANAALTFVREPDSPEFTQTDHIFADALAAQAALAFEFERARQDREQMMLVGDRERIGRDLHDLVIQRLFATGMGLQGLLPFIEQQAMRERVSDAIGSLDETIHEIRNTIFGLSRLMGDAGQVRGAVLDLTRRAAQTLGFEPAVRFDGAVDVGVPDNVIPHLLAVVREALSNCARHAHASAVEVHISLSTDVLVVAVTDDGIGLAALTRSSGLANLTERARLLGGTFDIVTPDVGGTRLEWRVPIRV